MRKFFGALSALLLLATSATAQDGRIPNQYIVQLKKPATDSPLAGFSLTEQAARLAAMHGGQVLYVYEHALRGFAVRMPEAAALALATDPVVASVNPDVRMRAIATQNGATWGLDRSDQRNLPLNSQYTYPDAAGQGVHVYVIDTGINPNHAEFTGRVGTSRNFVAPLLIGSADPNAWTDCNGHGTHVSSTSVGTTWGIAKKATIHAVRVLDCQGTGSGAAILAGIDWVAANHQSPAVANLSLGTLGGRSTDQETAVRNLVNANVAVAVAAGNDNANACNTSPAAEPAVLTTGATSSNDARASFSNFGTCVDLFAPGDTITAANYNNTTGSTTMSGTSMASPHVAGALALVRGGNTALTAAQAQAQLVADTTPGVVTNPGTGSPNKLLYVANAGGPPPVDSPPTAAFTFSCTGLACAFNGSSSTDDHGIASWSWNFGDSTSGTGATVNHTYGAAGTYSVTLTATDTVNQTDTDTQSVSVTSGGGSAPCTNCTQYSGTLASGGTAYHPGTGGFAWTGGTLKGYLRGPAGTDFDLYLQRYSCTIICTWSNAASAEGTTSVENISYNAASGTYRWRVTSYSGAGAYDFWGEPK